MPDGATDRRCLGEPEGSCNRRAVKSRTNGGYWCEECNEKRIERISRQMEKISKEWPSGN